MANRRFEMHEYRQVIHRMRMGQSDRAISESKLMGRLNCAQVRAVALQQGWLDCSVPIPDNHELVKLLEAEKGSNPTRESLSLVHEDRIRQWIEQGVWGTTIYRALVTAKFEDALPLYRQERIFARLGIDLPRATMAGWMIKTAEKAAPIIELFRREIRSGPVVNIDETPVMG